MLGMLSESRCSDVYALRNCSTMRCTASLSKRGGACSAQKFGAGLCKSPMLPQADPGAAMSAALVSGSVTPRLVQSCVGWFCMKLLRSAVLMHEYAKSAMLTMPASDNAVCNS